MAKLYKVWSKACVRLLGKRIEIIDNDDLKEEFDKLYDMAWGQGFFQDVLPEDEDEIDYDAQEKHYNQIYEYWEETKCINLGDYRIVEVESRDDITIPNCCGWDCDVIFG